MSLENFMIFLQQIITMTDPGDPVSVALAKTSVESVIALAYSSQKVDPATWRVMYSAEMRLDQLLRHKQDFAGKPGDYIGNQNKRHRLLNVLRPGC